MRGRVLSGRYELVEKLGAGGMGEVWRARDRDLGREVALKLFAPPDDVQAEERTELLGRFRREARAAAALDSPHIAVIHDHGAHDGTPYLVMELIDGRSLEQVLRDDGRAPPAQALDWAAQICLALGTAHTAGVVHRDIKPANIVVRPDGTAVVLDFGIAKFQEAVEAESKLTRTGHMPLGSVLYMAPERFRMEPGDGREDLYALGCVLYELLIGRPPFVGPAAGVMYNHLNDVPLRPSRARPELSASVDQLVLDLMAKSPDDRPADAAEAQARLVALRAGVEGPGGGPGTGAAGAAGTGTSGAAGTETAGAGARPERVPGRDAGPEPDAGPGPDTGPGPEPGPEAGVDAGDGPGPDPASKPGRGSEPVLAPVPRPKPSPKSSSSPKPSPSAQRARSAESGPRNGSGDQKEPASRPASRSEAGVGTGAGAGTGAGEEVTPSGWPPRKSTVRTLVGVGLGVVLLAGVGVGVGLGDGSGGGAGEDGGGAEPPVPSEAPHAGFDTTPPEPAPGDGTSDAPDASSRSGAYTVVYTSASAINRASAAPVLRAFAEARKSLGLKAAVDVVAVDSDTMDLDGIKRRYPDVVAVIGDTSGAAPGVLDPDYPGPDDDPGDPGDDLGDPDTGEAQPVTISTCGEPGEDSDLEPSGQHTFRLRPSPARVAAQLVTYLRRTHGARTPLIGDDQLHEEFAKRLRDEVSQGGGKAPVSGEDAGAGEELSLRSQVKKADADAVLLPYLAYDGEFAAQGLLRSGFRGPVLVPLASPSGCDPDLAKDKAEGPGEAGLKGIRRYRSSPPGAKAVTSLEHDAALAVAAALARQKGQPSSEAVRASLTRDLRKISAEGELGTVAFDAHGYAKDRTLWIDRFDGKRWQEEHRLAP
ncbi:serine/threonine-protein kinase [Streptomyces iconiensis]|uniref:non-specific serine/threonine protein kinase n=1 Tax=Streptomyces iconiensis TaxID=1384038 RepID=A0ABT7A2K8_9ACTN|nr:serine/threonine-protein kinase [Streptomyces iconiensis]MDJ1134848.1 bifunctional serine/threonine-protein kinase/ABC transporter substrate-binding protein [Streptomyces iconiensis]